MRFPSIFIGFACLFLFSCGTSDDASPRVVMPPASSGAASASAVQSRSSADQNRPVEWTARTIVEGLAVPWDVVFARNGDMFITERPGRLRILRGNGSLETVTNMPAVVARGESGLTGVALHPDFAANGDLYLYYSYRDRGGLLNRISRFTLQNGSLLNERFIVDALPGGSIHNGGRLRFGPDGKLWILTGDAGREDLARDPESLGGKVLRMNDDGSIPSDNPLPGSAVYSMGHRNPQGLDWHPATGELYVSEHGQTAHDEVNKIIAGADYGWPAEQLCDADDPSIVDPILCSERQTWAPSGLAFLQTPDGKTSLFLAGLRGEFLRSFDVDSVETVPLQTVLNDAGRIRAVTAGPDGALYVTTSNRDGRGRVRSGDDKVMRIAPNR